MMISPAVLLWLAASPEPGHWLELRTPHFDVITDADERHAAALLRHLERLRQLFVARAGLAPDACPPARVVAFRSRQEYAAYRLDEGGDAYFLASGDRDYIVMPLAGADDLRIAAHEYAHLLAHRQDLELPAWLGEGLAEVFSTVRIQASQAIVGAANPVRMRALQQGRWLPLAEVMAGRDHGEMFYAESWALTHMLLFSPAYGPKLMGMLLRAPPAKPPLARDLERDLRNWLAQPALPVMTIPAGAIEPEPLPAPAPLPLADAQLALADLDLVLGRRERASRAYSRLESISPRNPEIQAALARIALQDGRGIEGRERLHRAIALGIRDARLCYEFAMLAQDAGVPPADVVAALERALALDAGFDDARYALALAHMNAGRYADALHHFQALRLVPVRRAFAYYSALAHTQTELGMREEAARSVAEARMAAANQDEVSHADEIAWMAESDIVVQMTAAGSGRLLRIPHRQADAAAEWNPFIEPADRLERLEGDLQRVDCASGELRLVVLAGERSVALSAPHPERVHVRGAGASEFEFTCGPQPGARVRVEYAASPDPLAQVAGILRGIQFLP
jgi:tetratricopeptide (TPR) repeat protein